MKAKVEKRFIDYRCGNVARPTGSVFECTEERFDEISAKLPGFVSKVAEEQAGGCDEAAAGTETEAEDEEEAAAGTETEAEDEEEAATGTETKAAAGAAKKRTASRSK